MKAACVLLLGLLPFMANAAEVGDTLKPFTLNDQHDQAFSLDAGTRVLLAAGDMDGAKLVKAAVAEQPKGYLEARHAVFVADIQRMPALISKLFAVPAMRDYNYRVVLDRDGQVVPQYEVGEAQVLVLQLENGTLVSKQTFSDADALRKALDALPQG
ncbi:MULTISPECIES: FAD/FMN-containing dehydrogenase [unclassified Pseudomonas]|uniref:FAD/FMN-containing dehydrogenase n=1 Tax=unclassified Pseudomonas TaxID=196821 RepID=UPI0021C7BA36|nr:MULTISPECIES: FAD/FMN-containing dehydrogenase [unclassified Pseudomonas]MCU1733054.1 FAD/FMN-containing dehydrogenase [Pseudomonas sp. 20P_3.2_Bac4]MCU1744155.1 FAD/FMN-containing dehydrogenase [Pseudomonas sp. 20P_3.2_Bac5]